MGLTPSFAATYYASPGGGAAASCVDNGANVCTLQRAVTVAAGGTNTIECATGTYSITTALAFNATNTGANLTIQPASGATVTLGSSGSTTVIDIQATMISGDITFDGINITDSGADYSVNNSAPEVNVVYKNSTIINTDASQATAFRWQTDSTNEIVLETGEDTTTNLKTGATTNVKIAQKITVGGSNITINRAALKMQRRCGNIGTTCDEFVSGESWDYRNGDTLTVTIETDNAGAPSGTPVTNGTATTKLAFNVPYKSDEWESFTFASNVTLTASTVYWLVLTGSYTASTSNYIAVSTDTGGGYAGGGTSLFDGTNWSAETAGTDFLFGIDRAHTRNLTIQDNIITADGSAGFIGWSNTVTISRNTINDPDGGGFSFSVNGTNYWTVIDDYFKKVILEDNIFDIPGGTLVSAGVQTLSFTYLNSLIIKGNTGEINILTQPKQYVRKLFIYGNTLTTNEDSYFLFLGIETSGVDPMEINPVGFDQVVIENNDFTWQSTFINHMLLLAIGSEDGILINNTFRAPANSGSGSGGWGIIIKADRWTIIGNKFYGAGPAVYLTSNHSRVLYNTLESWDATGSNAALLFRSHQDQIYGGNHGIPKYNFVENNIFIGAGTYPGIRHCDTSVCGSGAATLGIGRTADFWSNRIDNNIYYSRGGGNQMQIGAGANAESVTEAEGISVARTAWQSSTYTDKNSISEYNDMSSNNSIIVSPSGIDGITYDFYTKDPNVIDKGTIQYSDIGVPQDIYQSSIRINSGKIRNAKFGYE